MSAKSAKRTKPKPSRKMSPKQPARLKAAKLGNAASPNRALLYWRLMRFDKPIGTALLLWPTLWALWFAAEGLPETKLLTIFIAGVILMRAAGCVINDFADRHIDSHVHRTQNRPMARGQVSAKEAIVLFMLLCITAFGLVIMTNGLTIGLAFGGVALAFCYPFMKRYTHLPQVVLGAAFAWSIPMAFAASTGTIDANSWLLYTAVVLWTITYDTFYAMVDRDDDIKLGVKSTAILFAEHDRLITACLQGLVLVSLLMVGSKFGMAQFYYLSIALAAGLFIYQQYLIKDREKGHCFRAFLNNNYVGLIIFSGIVADYAAKG